MLSSLNTPDHPVIGRSWVLIAHGTSELCLYGFILALFKYQRIVDFGIFRSLEASKRDANGFSKKKLVTSSNLSGLCLVTPLTFRGFSVFFGETPFCWNRSYTSLNRRVWIFWSHFEFPNSLQNARFTLVSDWRVTNFSTMKTSCSFVKIASFRRVSAILEWKSKHNFSAMTTNQRYQNNDVKTRQILLKNTKIRSFWES